MRIASDYTEATAKQAVLLISILARAEARTKLKCSITEIMMGSQSTASMSLTGEVCESGNP
jgi:hypothetical protein